MGTSSLREIRLRTEPERSDLEALRLGDIVYLDGTVYTAREGIYKRVVEDGVPLPLDLPAASGANCGRMAPGESARPGVSEKALGVNSKRICPASAGVFVFTSLGPNQIWELEIACARVDR